MENTAVSESIESVHSLPLSAIVPDPDQVRTAKNAGFGESDAKDLKDGSLTELEISISQFGVKTPIVVRKTEDPEHYMIVSGERRYRACCALGKLEIPAIIREYEDPADVKLEQITENIQRTGITPAETARFIVSFKKNWLVKHHEEINSADLANMLGKSKAWLTMNESYSKIPAELAKYFSDGHVSDSLRAGYDLIVLGSKHPEETLNWLDSQIASDPSFQVNNSNINDLKEQITFFTSKTETEEAAEIEEQEDAETSKGAKPEKVQQAPVMNCTYADASWQICLDTPCKDRTKVRLVNQNGDHIEAPASEIKITEFYLA